MASPVWPSWENDGRSFACSEHWATTKTLEFHVVCGKNTWIRNRRYSTTYYRHPTYCYRIVSLDGKCIPPLLNSLILWCWRDRNGVTEKMRMKNSNKLDKTELYLYFLCHRFNEVATRGRPICKHHFEISGGHWSCDSEQMSLSLSGVLSLRPGCQKSLVTCCHFSTWRSWPQQEVGSKATKALSH